MSITIRDYQLDLAERAHGRFRTTGKRGIVQGETGSGKTVVGCHLAACARGNGKRTLVLADRRRLIKQFGGTLEAMGVPHGQIMSGESRDTHQEIVLASRDTFWPWLEGGREFRAPDLIITDEAHKAMGATFQNILGRYPNAFVIGLTATPARDDGKSLGDFFSWIELTIPPSRLIADGHLIRPVEYAPLELARRRKTGEGKGLAGNPVTHWLNHAAGLPTIAFAANLNEAEDLAERFNAAGISSECVSAAVSDEPGPDGLSERDRTYNRLKYGVTRVLTSVGLLIEGVDIPEASCVILWSAFGSVVKYRQGCGRIMRPCPDINKTRAIVLDHSGAAGLHGLPGDDVEWSLDMASTVKDRRDKAIEEGRLAATVICRSCGVVYSGEPRCPGCGAPPPRPATKKKTASESYKASADAILERYTGEEATVLLREKRQRSWTSAIIKAVKNDAKAAQALAIFISTCKVKPWDAGVEPLAPNWSMKARDAFPDFAYAWRERVGA